MQLAIGIILIIAALFLIVSVLMQSGKSHNLSGTIAGGAETFFGKTKGGDIDKKLSKWTTVVAIVFVILVLLSYLLQDNLAEREYQQQLDSITTETTDDTTGDTTAETDPVIEGEETTADSVEGNSVEGDSVEG